jgi:hypothetical protein
LWWHAERWLMMTKMAMWWKAQSSTRFHPEAEISAAEHVILVATLNGLLLISAGESTWMRQYYPESRRI